MIVYISKDEWWPVYEITTKDGYFEHTKELTEYQVSFIKQAFEDFNTAQNMLFPNEQK